MLTFMCRCIHAPQQPAELGAAPAHKRAPAAARTSAGRQRGRPGGPPHCCQHALAAGTVATPAKTNIQGIQILKATELSAFVVVRTQCLLCALACCALCRYAGFRLEEVHAVLALRKGFVGGGRHGLQLTTFRAWKMERAVSVPLTVSLVCCPQTHPVGRLGIVAYLFIMHVLLVLCSFSSRHGPIP